MEDLEKYIAKIDEFPSISKGKQVDYICYYVSQYNDKVTFEISDIKETFERLSLPKYSNIPQYLLRNSKGKNIKFIKKGSKYTLERSYKNLLSKELKEYKPTYSGKYLPKDLFESTRPYIEAIGTEALIAYEQGLYNSALVMVRRVLETFIIEIFEKDQKDYLIKNPNGDFLFLSDLWKKLVGEYNIGRGSKKAFIKIKKFADLSAHDRRYLAKKKDLDDLKDDIRITVEELKILAFN
jgi:hypothetical protein